MKTKLEMAHEYALQLSKNPSVTATHNDKDIASRAWKYADAMQAEADKRECKERTDVLLTKDKDGNCLHFHHEFGHKKCMDCGASLEEWQPDWSQAPEWANWWAMDENKNTRWIYSQLEQPYTGDTFLMWFAVGMFDSEDAPSFGYTGDWRESLRKRPK